MPPVKSDRGVVGVLVVLSITQLVGWGTISLPAIIGRAIAADLGMDVASVFAGSSILYVVMGLCAPALAPAFIRFGARRVMMVGAMAAAPGFVLLAASRGPVCYFLSWVILGAAGSASLSTAAYVMLNEVAGRSAKRAIGALMLVTGLSSSIFWPITAYLSSTAGWRGVCLTYAAIMVLFCVPLYGLGLPSRSTPPDQADASASSPHSSSVPPKSTFYLIVSAIALNAFVTVGFSAVFVELLKSEGLEQSSAVAFGSTLGVLQVCARAADFLGGGRWDGIATSLVAGAALPISMLLLMIAGGSHWTVVLFILLYGLGSGALAVARATIPLVFYDKAEFTKATSRIALPMNLISAASPPVLVALLTRFGTHALLTVAVACSCGALFLLVLLSRRRPTVGAIATGQA
jgi:predicted MFS family arabinose efflux permease